MKISSGKWKGFIVDKDCCVRKKCFVPFSGNGLKICRIYELGQCPPEQTEKKEGEFGKLKED